MTNTVQPPMTPEEEAQVRAYLLRKGRRGSISMGIVGGMLTTIVRQRAELAALRSKVSLLQSRLAMSDQEASDLTRRLAKAT